MQRKVRGLSPRGAPPSGVANERCLAPGARRPRLREPLALHSRRGKSSSVAPALVPNPAKLSSPRNIQERLIEAHRAGRNGQPQAMSQPPGSESGGRGFKSRHRSDFRETHGSVLRAVSAVQRIAAAIRVCGDAEEFTGRAPAASETYAGPSCVLLLGGIRAARAGSAECGLVRTSVGSDVLPDTRTMRSRSSTSLRAASSRCDWARRSAGWALVRSSAWPRRRLGRIATRATSPSSSGPSRARSRGIQGRISTISGKRRPGPAAVHAKQHSSLGVRYGDPWHR